jgi:hypothetical protein
LVKLQKIAFKITQIVSCDHPAVLRNFPEWSISVWRKQTEDAPAKLCNVMQSVFGQVPCVLKAGRTMLKHGVRLVMNPSGRRGRELAKKC